MMYAACTTPKSKTSHGISTPRPGKALIILLWMEGFIRFIPIIIGFQPYKVMQDFVHPQYVNNYQSDIPRMRSGHPNHLSRIGMDYDYADTDAKLAVLACATPICAPLHPKVVGSPA